MGWGWVARLMIQDAVTVFSVSKYMSLHPLAETKDVACLFYSQ